MTGIKGEGVTIVPYDVTQTNFVDPIKGALGLSDIDDLANVHLKFENELPVTRETDSKTSIHQLYYEQIGSTDFYEQYRKFIHSVVGNLVDGPLIVQKIPTFRVHLPNNKAVGQYHRDSDFGHQPGAINFWVPVTPAFESNAIHIANTDDVDPSPVAVNVGEALAFDAVNLFHGNEVNLTGQSRVSFDFRVIPEHEYSESSKVSINTMTQLAIGGYYTYANEL